ncbi:NADH-cytochrome b5 reductase-like [Battus philenor]|uniref:NADH-cytochrome b5 reductase-like n=1 Tax=Battus philenor TaxID=42288 RepID=UPI0035CF3E4C
MSNMIRPSEPSKEDCCNSGCNPCIFDVYEKQLKIYEKLKEKNEISLQSVNGISQLEYTMFYVTDTVNVCDSHKLISFKRFNNDHIKIFWNPGDHFLLKYSINGTSCTRAYTPIKVREYLLNDCDFFIILKEYKTGLVSKFLYNLDKGDKTLWRGPYGNYEIVPNKYRRIIMVAQGTGIAPFISIIDNILNNENDMTKLYLFYCCSSYEVILFRNELYNYKSFWNFTYTIYLSSCMETEVCKYQEPINYGKLKHNNLNVLEPFTSSDQVLLCGSKHFMEEYKYILNSKGVLSNNTILF